MYLLIMCLLILLALLVSSFLFAQQTAPGGGWWGWKNGYYRSVGTQKQFFVDTYIVRSTYHAFRVLNQPVKHPLNPVIELKPAQRVGGKDLVIVSGSVLFDQQEGLF